MMLKKKVFKWLAIAAGSVFSIYVLFGFFGLPAIVKSKLPEIVSETTGRNCGLAKAAFNPFTLELRLGGFEVAGKREGNANLLSVGELVANAQISSLFLWRAELKRFALSDVELSIGLDDNGDLSIQDILTRLEEASVEEEDPVEAKEASPKARIQELEIGNVVLAFEDRSLENNYAETVTIETLTGAGIGNVARNRRASDEKYHWTFDMNASLGSDARIEAEGGALDVEDWSIESTTSVEGFSLGSLNAYLAEKTDLSVSGIESGVLKATVFTVDDALHATLGGSADVSNFKIEDADGPYAAFDRFGVEELSFSYPDLRFTIDSIAVENPIVWAARNADGEIRLPAMKGSDEADEETSDGDTDTSLSGLIKSFSVKGGEVRYKDLSFGEPLDTEIETIDFAAQPIAFSLENGEIDGSISASGSARFLGGEAKLVSLEIPSFTGRGTVEVEWDGLELSGAQPIISNYLEALVKKGVLKGDATASIDLEPFALATGTINAAVEDLRIDRLRSEEPLAQLERLAIEEALYSDAGLRVKKIVASAPALWVEKRVEGITLETVVKTTVETEQAMSDSLTKSTEDNINLPVIKIESIAVEGGRIEFVDTDLPSRHRSSVSDFEISLTNVSTEPGESARFNAGMVVDGASRIELNGAFLPSDPESVSSLELNIKGYDLVGTTGYWERYLGRELTKGQLEISSNYTIENRKIEGALGFSINQLTLGEKVEHEDALKLPLGLAIALLKDPNGRIQYDELGISGDLTDPKISVSGIVMKTLMNLVLKAATSPFQFLAKLEGGVENLDTVHFLTGSASLSEEAVGKAEALRKILTKRPELQIELSSFLDRVVEKPALDHRVFVWRLIDQSTAPNSLEELLAFEVDEPVYEEAIRSAFIAMNGVEKAPEIEAENLVEPVEKEKNKSLPAKLFSVFRSRKSDTSEKNIAVRETVSDPERPIPETTEGEVILPDFEEMEVAVKRAAVTSSVPEAWLAELERVRMLSFKNAVLAESGIDPSRLFQNSEREGSEEKGSHLKVELVGAQ